MKRLVKVISDQRWEAEQTLDEELGNLGSSPSSAVNELCDTGQLTHLSEPGCSYCLRLRF